MSDLPHAVRRAALALLLALPCTRVCALAPSPVDEEAPSGAAAFALHCARCHGATGDGVGTELLDRPARSFLDGGFSYGNTPDAIFRTLSHGIPGTPMPGFELLPEDVRRALAEHVIALGPPRVEVTPEETEMLVGARAVLARGMLPSIAGGAPEHPRGLLLGTPDGFSFEYRADDLRLLGVRQGAFVRRSDWTGRGGTPLQPLGRVVALLHDGTPPATFTHVAADGTSTPLACKLRATRLAGPSATLTGALVGPSDDFGLVHESMSAARHPFAAGFTRAFDLPAPTSGSLRVDLGVAAGGETLLATSDPSGGWTWLVLRAPAGEIRCLGVRAHEGAARLVPGPHGPCVELSSEPGSGPRRRIDVVTLLPGRWQPGDEHALLSESSR